MPATAVSRMSSIRARKFISKKDAQVRGPRFAFSNFIIRARLIPRH
jgi:hypothetical protein